MKCDIEIFLNGEWHTAASFELRGAGEIDRGVQGEGFFEYDLNYALRRLIAQAAPPPHKGFFHKGFRYEEVIDRGEEFIEYAREHNAPVAGSSGAQGEAPKFLLTQDRGGRWHADGSPGPAGGPGPNRVGCRIGGMLRNV